MPEHDPNTPTDPTAAADATPAAPAAPAIDESKFVSREDYNNLAAQLAHMNGQIAGMAAVVNRPVAPAAPPARQYTDDELAEMLESGDGRKILQAQRIINAQATQPLAEEFNNFRSATMVTAESLGRDIVEARGLIPHYKDPEIKRQVDAFLATLPPEARANRESLVLAHNYVVGNPENFERLMNKRVEEELRKRQGTPSSPDAGTPGGARVPQSGASDTPTVRELLGDQAAQALRFKGQSADEFAKKLGYKDWKTYAAVVQADQAANEGEELQ